MNNTKNIIIFVDWVNENKLPLGINVEVDLDFSSPNIELTIHDIHNSQIMQRLINPETSLNDIEILIKQFLSP